MLYLIPLVIIVFSLASIFYIVVRRLKTLPRAGEGDLVYPNFDYQAPLEEGQAETDSKGRIGAGSNFFIFMEKFFRKARVKVMKIENWLASMARRLHERGSRGLPRAVSRGKISAPHNADANGGLSSKPQEIKENMGSFVALNDKGGEFDEQYWLDIIKAEPKSGYPYKKLGEIYLAREDFREARSSLKYALRLDPADKEAVVKLEELRGKRTRKK